MITPVQQPTDGELYEALRGEIERVRVLAQRYDASGGLGCLLAGQIRGDLARAVMASAGGDRAQMRDALTRLTEWTPISELPE